MSRTVDFLGGKVKVVRDARFDLPSSDAVLLASAVPAKPGQRVLDVGMGSAIIPCLVNGRVKGLSFAGVEINAELCAIAERNAALNGVELAVVNGDVAQVKMAETFYQVVSNPPFFTEGPSSPKPPRGLARTQALQIGLWLGFCLKRIKAKGTLSFMHRTDLLPEILKILRDAGMGRVEIIPIFSKADQAANRVVVRACRNSRTPLRILPGLVVHNEDGSMTPEAEAILRGGASFR